MVPSRLPGKGSPKAQLVKAELESTLVTERVDAEKAAPTVYLSCTEAVVIVSTPPASAWVKAGTGSLRLSTASVARSSKVFPPAPPTLDSMRISLSVNTVKRAEPVLSVTTAPGSAKGS